MVSIQSIELISYNFLQILNEKCFQVLYYIYLAILRYRYALIQFIQSELQDDGTGICLMHDN